MRLVVAIWYALHLWAGDAGCDHVAAESREKARAAADDMARTPETAQKVAMKGEGP